MVGWTVAIIVLAWAVEERAFFGHGGQSIHFMVSKQRTCDARVSAAILIGALNLFPAD